MTGRLLRAKSKRSLIAGLMVTIVPASWASRFGWRAGPIAFVIFVSSGRLYYTNKLRFGAFRGFGNPQVSFATETQLDEIAERLGIDPFELRRKNAARAGDTWVGGGAIHTDGMVKALDIAQASSQWNERKHRTVAPGKRRAMGVASTAHICGVLGTAAIIRLLEDGTVVLSTGAVDIGQGSDTVLPQICADALKIPVDHVALASPDTDRSPFNWGTTASRVTYMTGRAVIGAANEVVEKIKTHAADMLECAVADLRFATAAVSESSVSRKRRFRFGMWRFVHIGVSAARS